MNATDMGTLLKWHGIPSSKQVSKQARVTKHKKPRNPPPPPPNFDKWTDQYEQKLHDIKSSKIDMKYTVLG